MLSLIIPPWKPISVDIKDICDHKAGPFEQVPLVFVEVNLIFQMGLNTFLKYSMNAVQSH